VYRDAQVYTARYDGQLRIFAQIPIQNRMFQYHLLRIFAMPFLPKPNSTLKIVKGLPPILAVASDLQTFIELNEADVKGCSAQSQTICPIHTGILKKNRPSCAFALHRNDTRSAETWCTTGATTNKGLTAAYLGERTWALSTFSEQTIVTSCANLETGVATAINKIQGFSILEIPSGCTTHTEEWVLPPSLTGQLATPTEEISGTINLPKLIWTDASTTAKSAAIHVKTDDNVDEDLLELRRRNEITTKKESKIIDDVHRLQEDERDEAPYPYEWAGTTVPLAIIAFGAILFLFYRLRRLEDRLRQHEKDVEGTEEAAIPLNPIETP
jgi:hypothetical protein